jgi:hypothetical protein
MRLISSILVIVLIVGCTDSGGGGVTPPVEAQLEASIASGATSFDFAAVPGFAWDRMFVFGPYTTKSEVENTLGFEWSDYQRTGIEALDSINLVVFVKDRTVVYWYEQSRFIELVGLANGKGYPRSDAKFRVAHHTDRAELLPIAAGD